MNIFLLLPIWALLHKKEQLFEIKHKNHVQHDSLPVTLKDLGLAHDFHV